MEVGGIQVITLAEAARRYGIDRTTLFRQAKAGVLRAEQSGRSWLVTTGEMERYMREHAGKPGRKRRASHDGGNAP